MYYYIVISGARILFDKKENLVLFENIMRNMLKALCLFYYLRLYYENIFFYFGIKMSAFEEKVCMTVMQFEWKMV